MVPDQNLHNLNARKIIYLNWDFTMTYDWPL